VAYLDKEVYAFDVDDLSDFPMDFNCDFDQVP